MPVLANTPKGLTPYLFHGVSLATGTEDYPNGQAVGTCPLCGTAEKFYVHIEDTRYTCFRCGAEGNATTFCRALYADCATSGPAFVELQTERRLLFPATLGEWGVVQSSLTEDWLVPGYGLDLEINNLYRYAGSPKRLLLPTPTLHHQLYGLPLFNANASRVFIVEGPWDGMALWEVLQLAGHADATVLAVPGCKTFREEWLVPLSGKQVCICFDSDHPKPHPKNGKLGEPAGMQGAKRLARMLHNHGHPTAGIYHLEWGPGGYDPGLPSGFDVRDFLSLPAFAAFLLREKIDPSSPTSVPVPAEVRKRLLDKLLAKLQPVPREWCEVVSASKVSPGSALASPNGVLEPAPCQEWSTLTEAWGKALEWINGLDHALSCMLASILSTPMIGDQLWLKVLSPPSTGKTVLCEALSIARKYVYPKDTLTRLTSGYQMDKDGSINLSLAGDLKDKTLLVNDGDTILRLPNREQVLSHLRAFYGRNLRSQYGNVMSADHEGISCTVIINGTKSLRELDGSELGERFLDVVIMEHVEDSLEDDICWRKIGQVDAYKGTLCDGKPETRQDPLLTEAMRLTGGYVEYLRRHGPGLLQSIDFSDEAKRQCVLYGKFVSYMRARPAYVQQHGVRGRKEESSSREMATRLVSQLGRLALCLAVVLNRRSVDAEVLRRVRQVALDTATGTTLQLTRYLASEKYRETGATPLSLGVWSNLTEARMQELIRFLSEIRVLELAGPGSRLSGGEVRWKLSTRVLKLWEEVHAEHTP